MIKFSTSAFSVGQSERGTLTDDLDSCIRSVMRDLSEKTGRPVQPSELIITVRVEGMLMEPDET